MNLYFILTMVKYFFIFILCLFTPSPMMGQTQEARARVAVVSMIDTVATHVYGNRWYSSSFKKDIFNYGEETYLGLTNILGTANLEVIEVYTPDYINKMALLNLFNDPSKGMEQWFDELKDKLQIDFLVVVLRKFEPENKISHRFLNGKQYGVGTYSRYPDAINIFSFVGYHIFDIEKSQEIKINKNHDQYLLMDLRLDKRLTYPELKDLPQKYLDLTRDKMRQVVNTRNVEIKRSLLEYLNE